MNWQLVMQSDNKDLSILRTYIKMHWKNLIRIKTKPVK